VEEDEKEEDEEEEDEDEEEDKNEDDGNEPWMIRQGEMVNTSPHNVDTMVDKQPIVLSDQAQEVREHTTRPQPPGPAPSLQTLHSSAMTTIFIESCPHRAGAFGASDAAKTSPSGANTASS
jgi:hypothetical protein